MTEMVLILKVWQSKILSKTLTYKTIYEKRLKNPEKCLWKFITLFLFLRLSDFWKWRLSQEINRRRSKSWQQTEAGNDQTTVSLRNFLTRFYEKTNLGESVMLILQFLRLRNCLTIWFYVKQILVSQNLSFFLQFLRLRNWRTLIFYVKPFINNFFQIRLSNLISCHSWC